jgi:hypothetical protein
MKLANFVFFHEIDAAVRTYCILCPGRLQLAINEESIGTIGGVAIWTCKKSSTDMFLKHCIGKSAVQEYNNSSVPLSSPSDMYPDH